MSSTSSSTPSDTPLYDALLADLVARVRAGDDAVRLSSAARALHVAGPGGRCAGCGLDAPCPSARLLAGDVDLVAARAEARRLLLARAVEEAASRSVVRQPDDTEPDDADPRPAPVLPSAAELFAPNPGTARALDALLGAPSGV